MKYSADNPWIAEREATLCTWKFDYNRGYVGNMSVSLVNDFMTLSARQITSYALMIKACGFTGIQVMDICAAWRANGSWENVHDKFKLLADACHANGLNFTVWCWAAEFSGHGWTEPDAVYRNSDPSKPACEDPRVLSLFNKYYDIYADLAPYADRVIAHFFDPGNLTDMTSIIYFIKLLASKFRAKNPDIKIAVDTWGSPADYPQALIDAGMKDVMLMELPFLPVWREQGKRASFREGIKKLGCGLGVWGWYTADMEIDQLASMTVNGRVLKDVLSQTRAQADNVLVPSYWSETDSYHVLNFFSLYAAGHLLIDPDDDPDSLLIESAALITGNVGEDTARLVKVLEFIRDARSGDSWDSYWWTEPGYVLTNYDHENILSRSDGVILALSELLARPEPDKGIPFPLKRKQLYKLIMPHIYQIRQYADFCRGLEELKQLHERGSDNEVLSLKVSELSAMCEIPEYNCVTGMWGQFEARAAFERLDAFCIKNGLARPSRSPSVRFKFKRRIIDRLTVSQRGINEPVIVDPSFYEVGLTGPEFLRSLMDELTCEGVLSKTPGGMYYLSDWESSRFDFSM
ncbi:MAG: hypothetical protein J5950_04870 [Clostridia bacterium]|nr:hypothetical protein [Clostridia bacterium]